MVTVVPPQGVRPTREFANSSSAFIVFESWLKVCWEGVE